MDRFKRELFLRWIMWMVIDIVVSILLMCVFPNVVKDTFIIATLLGCVVFCWCLEWVLHFAKIRKFKSWRWAASIAGGGIGAFVLGLVMLALGVL